ncbi:MAG: sugar transferase [Chloroflexi bacterium]|nr:sugar transferase [Chloroflexota bacterium]MCI0812478.1 sugar transferase [Chloroflexota bacterium]MCI0887682.1 sugar transferase [Chloroflexota bacterium]
MKAKRSLDLTVALLMLTFLLPIFGLVAILIKLTSKGPVFYRQLRAGEGGDTFRMVKFRSMVVDAEHKGLKFEVASDDDRITRIGKLLRGWGIDELPQLFNVLKGDVSLVGPRAARVDQIEHFTRDEFRRMTMKPGITGWAVVNGRNEIDWKKRIELDIWYVEHWSFWLDVKILLKTLWVILVTRNGVYGPEGVTRDYTYDKP